MKGYTPTTEQVRLDYVMAYSEKESSQILAEQDFDRWLAEVERAAAAEALEEAARQIYPRDSGEGIRLELRARAEAYRKERKEQ